MTLLCNAIIGSVKIIADSTTRLCTISELKKIEVNLIHCWTPPPPPSVLSFRPENFLKNGSQCLIRTGSRLTNTVKQTDEIRNGFETQNFRALHAFDDDKFQFLIVAKSTERLCGKNSK